MLDPGTGGWAHALCCSFCNPPATPAPPWTTIFSLNYPWMPLDWLLREQIQCHNPRPKRLSSKSHLVKRSVCQLHERRMRIRIQLQPPYGPSVDWLCHPCITTICIFIVACFCGITGIICNRWSALGLRNFSAGTRSDSGNVFFDLTFVAGGRGEGSFSCIVAEWNLVLPL